MLCDGETCVSPPADAVAVPGGPFMMGCNEDLDASCGDDEYPYHEVVLSSFAIDQTEVTADEFAECQDAGVCSALATMTAFDQPCPPTSDNQPVVCVDWYQARDYCEWRGGSLPTEAQWEKAARGDDGRTYPWGEATVTCTLAQALDTCMPPGPIDVGSKPAGASPYGALDMAGNVFEWVADWYSPSYYVSSPTQDPVGPGSGEARGIRSGYFQYNGYSARTSCRGPNYDVPTPDDANVDVGFRCAYAPPFE